MDNKTFTKKYYIDRKNANTVKWQRGRKLKCLPMWVADMDFKDDERVIEKLKEFIEKGDYGYNNLPEDYFDVFISWHKKRNNVEYDRNTIRFTRGAVDGLYQVVYALTQKGDGILINTPLYPPFRSTILNTGRKVYEVKMIDNDGYFTFDYKAIERKFKTGKVKMLMMCSPHNPVGRVFKKGELEELFDLCHKYHVLILSDEVHSDIIMPDQEFIPALALKKYRNEVISLVAASKSFSLAVFSHCHVIIPNKKLFNKFTAYQQSLHLGSVNVFNALPTYYNYMYGEGWLDALNNVVYENYSYFCKELSPYFEISNLEGSYLIFVNIGKYNKGDSAAKYLIEKCGLLFNEGETFDPDYNNWVRINLATSLNNVKKAVKALKGIIE